VKHMFPWLIWTWLQICRDVLEANLGVRWDDIAGLQDAKQVLQENCVLPLLMPNFFQGIRRPVKVPRLHPTPIHPRGA